MNKLLALAALAALPSCTFHVYLHQDPPPASPGASQSQAVHAEAIATPGSVSGIVLDADGSPVLARVAVVRASGSHARTSNEDGSFHFEGIDWPESVLHVSTEDGRVGIVPFVRTGTTGIQVRVRPGASVSIELRGEQALRCAVFQSDMRLEDFTLRPGSAARVVVPPGETRIQVYSGDSIRSEQTIRLAVGEQAAIAMES